MIFHIIGASGSGKSTLGIKLKNLKNTFILDTDDIDDYNSLLLLEKMKIKNKNDIEKFFNKKKILNEKKLNKIIQEHKNHNIIFVGFNFVGMDKIFELSDYKYIIKISADKLYRQYNLRTLKFIKKNYKELELLMENDKISIDHIHQLLRYKYKIRSNVFDLKYNSDTIEKKLLEYYQVNESKGYKLLPNDKIYKDIIEKIKN